MPLKSYTEAVQHELTRYVRSGEGLPIPGVRTDRAGEYRRLTYSIVKSTLDRMYPIARQVLGEADWNALIEDFFREHDCPSPFLWRMPKELCHYTELAETPIAIRHPYLRDLFLFEWIEVEVGMMPDGDSGPYLKGGNLWRDPLVFNPDFIITSLAYPVFRVAAAELCKHKGAYKLLCFRDRADFTVSFMELSGPVAAFIQEAAKTPRPAAELCAELEFQLDGISIEQLEAALKEFIVAANTQGLILGTCRLQ